MMMIKNQCGTLFPNVITATILFDNSFEVLQTPSPLSRQHIQGVISPLATPGFIVRYVRQPSFVLHAQNSIDIYYILLSGNF